ncbi:MAG: phosphatidylserine decarboxylase family protein [Deltaproteobacteria bacterium]|nr:phosphatidylserine decarboxylase family protein [Deltaproteobacteria bacterium]
MNYPIIAREGYPIIFSVCAAAIILLAGGRIASGGGAVFLNVLGIIACLFLLFSLYFFRDPERSVIRDANALISPADGTVIDIKTVTEDRYLQAPAQRISIFMSVFNVHVNRTPLSGTIEYIQYNPGKFINAFKEKASEDNENLLIGIRAQEGGVKIAVRFIAGLIARRIVFYKKKDDRVEQGERINIIRFGSRVDLFCPPGSEILVKSGQKVTAGITVMARLRAT